MNVPSGAPGRQDSQTLRQVAHLVGAGNPFHAGVPWKAMEAELKVMSHTLAT